MVDRLFAKGVLYILCMHIAHTFDKKSLPWFNQTSSQHPVARRSKQAQGRKPLQITFALGLREICDSGCQPNLQSSFPFGIKFQSQNSKISNSVHELEIPFPPGSISSFSSFSSFSSSLACQLSRSTTRKRG